MPYPSPSYDDGLQAVIALSVYCYNNGIIYMTYDGDPSQGAAMTELMNSDKQLIGSVTYAGGARKGTLNCQYNLAADELPGDAHELKNGYVVSFRSRFYVVSESKPKVVKNDVIKFSCTVTEIVNPIMSALLTQLGQQYPVAHAASSLFTVDGSAINTRSGGTVVYTLETFATPGSAAPSGFTISSSTGLVSINATAGTYDVRVVATETVTLADGTTSINKGWGRITAVLS